MVGDDRRVILMVLDSVGCGELPDAPRYGDQGSNTLLHIALHQGGLRLPNLGRLGLGNILSIPGVPPTDQPIAAFGKMQEVSSGKDTTTGHWEIAGVLLDKPFPTYPNGFPGDIIQAFSKAVGRGVLGNKPASGTAILDELGSIHMQTGDAIVYTSADSVFQIAAHEDVIPVERLYVMCGIARGILQGKHAVGRVIARPFTGQPGHFTRTANRRDFSLPPTGPTLLDHVVGAGMSVRAVGKIEDIFAGRGVTHAIHTANNDETIDKTIHYMRTTPESGLIFANCVDFDSMYGHRNDPAGYARALEAFDARVPELLGAMRPGDLLIITADHGNDPTTPSTDHSREYTPLLALTFHALRQAAPRKVDLGVRSTFSDVAATGADWLGLSALPHGTSFASFIPPNIP